MAKYEYALLDHQAFYIGSKSFWADKYYYTPIFRNENQKLVEFLNELGMDGWELTGVKGDTYLFKREITDEKLAKLLEEQQAKEMERRAQMTDAERAYELVENTPELQHSSVVYGYIAKLKQEEMSYDEFKVKVDELLKQ